MNDFAAYASEKPDFHREPVSLTIRRMMDRAGGTKDTTVYSTPSNPLKYHLEGAHQHGSRFYEGNRLVVPRVTFARMVRLARVRCCKVCVRYLEANP